MVNPKKDCQILVKNNKNDLGLPEQAGTLGLKLHCYSLFIPISSSQVVNCAYFANDIYYQYWL